MTLHRLELAIPNLRTIKSEKPRVFDWDALSRELGTGIPGDFKELAESYPSFNISDFLALYIPEPGQEVAYAQSWKDDERLASLHADDLTYGYAPYPAPGGLIVWGASNEGDNFYWRTNDGDPDSWTIVVEGRNDDWCTYEGTLTDYLAGLVTGTVTTDGLPSDFPGRDPVIDL
ncbi:hypothetical protein ACFWJQ_21510 [Streptomyces goshikiensis]|uniref:hypothetical protein n=1 Tax=Streptomyces goshikiensis TaxID=1942 RepID=UPI00364EA635